MTVPNFNAQAYNYAVVGNKNNRANQNTSFGNSYYNNQDFAGTSPKYAQPKKEGSTIGKVMKFITVLGLGAGLTYLGANQIMLSKNMKALSGELSEASRAKLGKFSLNDRVEITKEIIAKKGSGKADNIIDNIAKEKNLREKKLFERILETLWII